MNGHTQSITYCKSAKATNPIKLNAGLFLSIKAIDADILRVIEIEMENNVLRAMRRDSGILANKIQSLQNH